jgi:hypothetical protein
LLVLLLLVVPRLLLLLVLLQTSQHHQLPAVQQQHRLHLLLLLLVHLLSRQQHHQQLLLNHHQQRQPPPQVLLLQVQLLQPLLQLPQQQLLPRLPLAALLLPAVPRSRAALLLHPQAAAHALSGWLHSSPACTQQATHRCCKQPQRAPTIC